MKFLSHLDRSCIIRNINQSWRKTSKIWRKKIQILKKLPLIQVKLGGVNSSINIAGSQSDFPYSHVLTNKISLSNLIVARIILELTMRKLRYHEKRLLKKVDFFNWDEDKDLPILHRYHIQKRTEYIKYVFNFHSIILISSNSI